MHPAYSPTLRYPASCPADLRGAALKVECEPRMLKPRSVSVGSPQRSVAWTGPQGCTRAPLLGPERRSGSSRERGTPMSQGRPPQETWAASCGAA